MPVFFQDLFYVTEIVTIINACLKEISFLAAVVVCRLRHFSSFLECSFYDGWWKLFFFKSFFHDLALSFEVTVFRKVSSQPPKLSEGYVGQPFF